MYVIRDTAGRDQLAVASPQNSAEVFVETRLYLRREARFAMLRAEDQVVMEAGERLGHRMRFQF
jgi:hypothetical protein